MKSSFTSLLLTVTTVMTFHTTAVKAQEADNGCPVCMYDEFREPDCYVWGPTTSADTAETRAYPRVHDQCLDQLGLLEDRFMPSWQFWGICPFPNGTGYNVDFFINYIRDYTEEPEAQFAMAQFVENMDFEIFSNATGLYDLPSRINNSVTGNSFNCDPLNGATAREVTQCWDQVKIQVTARYPRFAIICQRWHANTIPYYYREQATARRMLCVNDGLNETVLEECEMQFNMIQDLGLSDCTAVEAQVPGPSANADCPDPTEEEPSGDSGATATTTASSFMLVGTAVTCLLLAVAFGSAV